MGENEPIFRENHQMGPWEQYEKRPVVVRARQNLGAPFEIETLEGTMICGTGDFEVEGTEGERYPVKKHILPRIYKKIPAQVNAESKDGGQNGQD